MENNTQPKRLTRGNFLTALALSLTGTVGILQGCSGGGGGGGTEPTPTPTPGSGGTTRDQLLARWNSISMSAEGKNTTCPGSLSLSGGSVSCGGFMEFKNDNTYVANFAGEADNGTWTLSGTTLTLNSAAGQGTRVMTIGSITASTLAVIFDGITVNHTKATSATPTPTPTPTPAPTPTPTPAPTPTPRPTVKKTFSYTGTTQRFLIPAGVTSITVKIWGAGGGQNGGSGAFVSGTLAVTPGDNLYIHPGKGGQIKLNGTTSSADEGGGTGNGDTTWAGGGGGGRTYIANGGFITKVEVGAGGGGQFYGGGGGGVTAGLTGSGDGGAGGTQAAGGPAGSGAAHGTSGGPYFGGNGGQNSGGGGAGNYGGAGGGNSFNGGGGGGSSYTTALTSLTSANGKTQTLSADVSSATLPGGATDPDYVAGVGVGGANNQAGGHGRIVITYLG